MANPGKIEYSKLLDYYGNLLTPYQKEILREYYDCDLSILEIAEEYGVSRQAVSDLIRRAALKLTETDAKLEVIRHSEEAKRKLVNFGEKWLKAMPEEARAEFETILETVREI